MFSVKKLDRIFFWLAIGLIVYMPLHVFIAQSASLVTGGLDVWKAAKDVLLVVSVPLLLYAAYMRGLFHDKSFRLIMVIGGIYTLLHGLFVVFDQSDDTYSAIVGSVYNTRLLGFLLLGYVVGSAKKGKHYLRVLLTASVLIAAAVALLGVLQYFLPPDLLENVGYSLERGVKPLFFIDDKPDLPRVMSTLKDPNSLGAYLILPILLVGMTLVRRKTAKALFVLQFKRRTLGFMLIVMLSALALTFSRGAALGLGLAVVTAVFLTTSNKKQLIRKYAWLVGLATVLVVGGLFIARDSYIVQNIVFHADESTVLDDPNEKRVSITQDIVRDVVQSPLGEGPGSAGLVSISNPQGTVLTENYYLQIAYEVGWLGVLAFSLILACVAKKLYSNKKDAASVVMLAALVAYIFYSLLIHLWSNEAVALQWWLLTGAVLGLFYRETRK